MRLTKGKVPVLGNEIIDTLVQEEAIEVSEDSRHEAVKDVESILFEYIRTEQEIHEEAQHSLRKRGLGNSAFARTKRQIARSRGFSYGPDAQEWIVEQIIEILLYTDHIEEVFAEDRTLRQTINTVFKKYLRGDDKMKLIRREAKSKLKNLEEGSAAWELEYERLMGNLKKLRKVE